MTKLRRRVVSIPAVILGAVLLLVLAPIWLPVTLIVDLVTAPRRLPRTRLLLFGLCWSWLETIALGVCFVLWVTRRPLGPWYTLQRWWAARIVGSLRVVCGFRMDVEGAGVTMPGPVVVFGRHASLADSIASLFIVAPDAHTKPHYVLKRELLADPCLDIAGNRIPNHFLDRAATDSGPELASLTALSTGMGAEDVAVIFPEGTRSNPKKRARALEKIAARDPARAERLRGLRHLLPPRPAGSAALLAGTPDSDVVILGHIGFEGLDTFGGILRRLPRKPPVRMWLRRIPRSEIPADDTAFTVWLDKTWLTLDDEVDTALRAEAGPTEVEPA
ncbi:MAG: 1-acyl-sn-glycerol-3-phosphate acyltransferase [Acidimicrobiia bacterium]|nr:1-acyl-sn-glycerol-3-phosphate acyltransferase [Acidimicrobiia bacterium]